MLKIPQKDKTKANLISMFDRLMSVKENILDLTKKQYDGFSEIDKNNTIRVLRTLSCNCTGNTMRIANKKRISFEKKIDELLKDK